MQLVNATPHTIHILTNIGVEQDPKAKTYLALKNDVQFLHVLPASGILPRVIMTETAGEAIAGIPTETVVYGEIENLPPQQEGIYYITSAVVAIAARAKGRTDCLSPSKLVRNKANPSEVLGCLALGR